MPKHDMMTDVAVRVPRVVVGALLLTSATVSLEQPGDLFAITRIDLDTTAEVPNLDDATFQLLT